MSGPSHHFCRWRSTNRYGCKQNSSNGTARLFPMWFHSFLRSSLRSQANRRRFTPAKRRGRPCACRTESACSPTATQHNPFIIETSNKIPCEFQVIVPKTCGLISTWVKNPLVHRCSSIVAIYPNLTLKSKLAFKITKLIIF